MDFAFTKENISLIKILCHKFLFGKILLKELTRFAFLFNPLMPGGNKRPHTLKKTPEIFICRKKQVCLSIYEVSLRLCINGLNILVQKTKLKL